ncbi:MAG: glycerate kinase [Bacteroidales bacterium]|nr:glycerate kinase [Bacteroidales bacterium]
MNHRIIAEQIFSAGVSRVLPEKLITKSMDLQDNHLLIGPLDFSLETVRNIYVIGAGKASAMMAGEVEKILGPRITEGHIVVKYGHSSKLKYIKVTEAGHPLPDSNGFKATSNILKIASKAGNNDLVICLLSGGGSALLPDFPSGSSLEELMKVNDLLINCGAGIKDINAVRKHLSVIKGGNLARAVYPAALVSLILSDVPGDPLDVIASGPTTPDPTTFQQALDVLEKFDLIKSTPGRLLKHLNDGKTGIRPETPKPGDPVFKNVHNLLIGTNRLALEAAAQKALDLKIHPFIIDDQLQGDADSVAEYIVKTSVEFKNNENEIKPVCLLFGGEITVKMTGKGRGGRSQHLALLCSKLLKDHPGITILSAGTDGNDGPTDAAGAVVDSDTVPDALAENVDPEKYLRDFDSYHFFEKEGGHIITGPTLTNVMDIIVAVVE